MPRRKCRKCGAKEGGTVLGRPEDVPDDCKEARAERGAQNDGGWG